MIAGNKILGLIPARGGSKGIVGKNIIPLGGRPLIEYTIDAAIKSKSLDRIIVSTDDKKIAEIAQKSGAEVPFMRPEVIACDQSTALEVIQHSINTLQEKENWAPDFIVYLQPTSPLRRPESISEAINKFTESDSDSLVSVIRVPHHFSVDSQLELVGEHLKPFRKKVTEVYRRQDKPVYFARNGPAILVVRYATIMNANSLYGDTVLPFEMSAEESIDIDEIEDIEFAEWILSKRIKKG